MSIWFRVWGLGFRLGGTLTFWMRALRVAMSNLLPSSLFRVFRIRA